MVCSHIHDTFKANECIGLHCCDGGGGRGTVEPEAAAAAAAAAAVVYGVTATATAPTNNKDAGMCRTDVYERKEDQVGFGVKN